MYLIKGKIKGRNIDIEKLFADPGSEKLKSKKVNFKKLAPAYDYVGRLNMDLQVEGKGVDMANLDAHLMGTLDSHEFLGNKIDKNHIEWGS